VPLPAVQPDGLLLPGIHAATLHEIEARFGVGSEARQQQIELLRRIVDAARSYPTIKRVLVWGSFVTTKPEPRDLDYSVVVSVAHRGTQIAIEHRRFFVPSDARRHYGVDRNYLVVPDYPLDYYIEKLDFFCQARDGRACGIVEVSLRGEYTGDSI
jgi:uncharacterized protein DUF6932